MISPRRILIVSSPGKYDSRIDFMFEILKYFSIDSARKKNHSFRFFVERYHLEDPAGEHGDSINSFLSFHRGGEASK